MEFYTDKIPICKKSGFVGVKRQECTWIGIEKRIQGIDSSQSQCTGVPINYICYEWIGPIGITGRGKQIPCD